MRCRNCQLRKGCRAHGLCYLCCRYEEIRARHRPVASTVRVSTAPNYYGPSPLPRTPTAAIPGSAEKIAVLAERAILGVALFHPEDARPT